MRPVPQHIGGILSYFTRHRTAANLLLVVMIVLGLASLPRMRAQFFPDVVFENISVSVAWPGAGPEDIDRGIIQVLEPDLLVLDGVDNVFSTSREGSAVINLEFETNWDMSQAMEDVKAAVDAQTQLPETAEEPSLRRGRFRDRVTDVVISGPVGLDQLARFTDEFVARLYARDVTNVTIAGVAAPQVLIEVSSHKLLAHDLSMRDIANAVAEQSTTSPAGDLSSASARLRLGQERRSAEDIAAITLVTDKDGRRLRVSDVATVTVMPIDRLGAYYVGDRPALSLRVDRTAEGDAIGLQQIVEEEAKSYLEVLPEGMDVSLVRTRAEAISGRLNILLDNALSGLFLVLLLLFMFLNARTAFWVAMGIPTALLFALALMYASGLTINMISLFALILTLGIVVDDAIVVGEHADWRARNGEESFTAAENAARRMAMPVFSATLTTIIAFFGLVAIGGRFGDLIKDIPFTVIVVLAASFIECFLVLPNHMAHSVGKDRGQAWYDWPSRQVNRGFRYIRDAAFRPLISGVMTARYVVLAAVIAVLAYHISLVMTREVQWRFFNPPERTSVTGNFVMLDGATRDDSLVMMHEMQRAVAQVGQNFQEEHGRNPIKFAMAQVGASAGRGIEAAADKDKDLMGAVSIELIDADLRPYSSAEITRAISEEIKRPALLETVTFRRSWFGPGGDSIDIMLWGAEPQRLKEAADAIKFELSVFPEVSGLDDSLPYGKDEMRLELTAQGRALGFDLSQLNRVLRDRLGGVEALSFPAGSRSGTIDVELPEGELTSDFLDTTMVRSPSGTQVPLMDIVTVTRTAAFSSITRENGIQRISVTGEVSEDDPDRARMIQDVLGQEILPDVAARYQIDYKITGLAEQEREFLSDAMIGLWLSLLGIYLVLSLVFASWTQPFTVMIVIPFGLIGAIYGHYMWEVPLSMFSIVGLLGMTGIVINDSIVLVTTIQQESKDKPLRLAILDGASSRLRPVLLTTLTTVLGLMPLLFETSRDAQFLKPTVITLVYGLGFGMVLVLLVVPAIMTIGSDLQRGFQALRRALFFRGSGLRRVFVTALGNALLIWAGLSAAAIVLWSWPIWALPIIAFGAVSFAAMMVLGLRRAT
ncbi:MAG: efflux RND transporter permease subunit [Paracoccaceae bacterium]